jgi:hypothetical protein
LAVEIHLPGKILKDGNGLDVEIPEHSVALPASEETDQVAVDAGGNEGHGSGSPEGFDGGICRLVSEEDGGLAQVDVDSIGGDAELASPVSLVVAVDGGVVRRAVTTEVDDAPGDGSNGAEERITTGTMADLLAAVGILLIREGEDAEGGGEKVVVACRGEVELSRSTPELELVGVERVRSIFAGGGAVLARPHQKVIGDDDEVGDGLARIGRVGVGAGCFGEMAKDLDRNRSDAPWRGVGLRIVPQLVL